MSQTTGFIHAVPCPRCGHGNNFSSLHEDMGASYGTGGLEVGTKVDCDKCGHISTITGIFRDPFVFVSGNGKRLAGPLSNVPCPSCDKHNNFAGVSSELGASFEGGVVGECDHCHSKFSIDKVDRTLRVRLAP